MPVQSGQELLHFRLLEKLGEGGMGAVWRAHDAVLGREVAIKFLPESVVADAARLADFEREARLLAALDHPNIVTVHSLESDGARRFLTMELVRGSTLEALIRPGGLPAAEFFRFALALCDGLGAAHERGIIHGDLKPRNVMIAEDGRIKLLDFGLARSLPRGIVDESGPVTQADTLPLAQGRPISGTLPYMSPERLLGRPADARSDLFSLGVILYEMATGQHPFTRGTVSELIASILRDTPRPAGELRPDLPRRVDLVIASCLARDPAERPATAGHVRRLLDEARGLGPDAATGGAPSIAVLPFADMSPEKDQDFFCEGIADEIINALTRIADLRVAARTSSFQFRGSTLGVKEIGDRLGVRVVLEGAVRKAGDRIRVTVDLVNVADGFRIWSRRYDRELQDVFAIQEEIAGSVARSLEVSLSPRVRRAIVQVATSDVEAYEYYLRGRKYFYQYGRRGILCALEMFERAIGKDPAYALAHAGIADCCSYLYLNSDHADAHRERAERASARALELDPELPEAHVTRAVALSLTGRDDEVVQAFENAVRLNPRLFEARYFYARHSFASGNPQKAIRLYAEAFRIRPDDYQAPLLVAQIHDDLGQPEMAAAMRREGTRLAARRLDLNPDDVRALYMGANGLITLGEVERGLAWSRRARQIEPDDPMLMYNLACNHALAGEPDEALDCLDRALALGFAFRGWIERDSNLAGLRASPRYRALLERLPQT